MRNLKFKAQPTNAFFATVNQMFGGGSQLPTTAERAVIKSKRRLQFRQPKPKPKQLLRPITTAADSAMNQSQFLAISCNSLETRKKSRVHGAIGFGFDSHSLKNWHESFKPINERRNRNHAITFDSHLKTALRTLIVILIVNGVQHFIVHTLTWSLSEDPRNREIV